MLSMSRMQVTGNSGRIEMSIAIAAKNGVKEDIATEAETTGKMDKPLSADLLLRKMNA